MWPGFVCRIRPDAGNGVRPQVRARNSGTTRRGAEAPGDVRPRPRRNPRTGGGAVLSPRRATEVLPALLVVHPRPSRREVRSRPGRDIGKPVPLLKRPRKTGEKMPGTAVERTVTPVDVQRRKAAASHTRQAGRPRPAAARRAAADSVARVGRAYPCSRSSQAATVVGRDAARSAARVRISPHLPTGHFLGKLLGFFWALVSHWIPHTKEGVSHQP